jgi:hypothetical protein
VIDHELIDDLMPQVEADGVDLLGPDGVFTDLAERIMERALDVERTDQLGYELGDPAGSVRATPATARHPRRADLRVSTTL